MKKKIFRDSVHGYITLSENQLKIVDTPLFQRLSSIRQGPCRYTYPCANHTRFEHSLGVLHTSSQIFESILRNSTGINAYLKRNKINIMFAALAHDIGHAPFSHIGEVFYPRKELISEISKLRTFTESERTNLDKAMNHELMSGLIILKNTEIVNILKNCGANTKLIFNMICGIYDTDIDSLNNCLVQIMHSSMDADRIDYILRDNVSTGAELVAVDTNRLTNNYLIFKNLLRIKHQASSSVANFVYGRTAIYEWIINHHKNVLIAGILGSYIDHLKRTENNGAKIKGLRNGIKRFSDYFTYRGIVECLIDDIDLLSVFKSNKDIDEKTKVYYEHIFERKHFKPIWKTPFEFDKIFKGYDDYDGKVTVVGFKDHKNTTEYKRLYGFEKLIKRKFPGLDDKNKETVFAFMCESRYYKNLPTKVRYNNINMYSKVKHIRNYEFCEAYKNKLYTHIDEYPFLYLREDMHKRYKQKIIRFLQKYPT